MAGNIACWYMQVTEGMDASSRWFYSQRQAQRKRLPRPFTGKHAAKLPKATMTPPSAHSAVLQYSVGGEALSRSTPLLTHTKLLMFSVKPGWSKP